MPLRTNGQFFGETQRQTSAEGLTLSENRYAPGQVTPRHAHETMLFYYVLEGACHEEAPGRERIHLPETLVFLPAGETHSTFWSPDTTGLCFHLELTESYWQSRHMDRNLSAPSHLSLSSRGALFALIQKLHGEFLHWDSLSSLVAEGIVLQFLGEFARNQWSDKAQYGDAWLSVVEARLRQNPKSLPSLAELANLVQIHPSHLVRAFRQRYGVTPGEFVRQLRIEEACRYLRRTPEIPLSELALELGFADQSHFIRTFRRQVGVTPGIYRRNSAKRRL